MKLIRKDIQTLNTWWNSPLRSKPCILFGARQVGKSTLALDFIKSVNKEAIVVNFWKDNDEKFKNIFKYKSGAKTAISKLESLLGHRINKENHVLLFDEIQSCPAVYSMCKSFCEDIDIPVIATGSYLKLFLKLDNFDKDFEVPVGCTYEKHITPLLFSEFLLNVNPILYETFINANVEKKLDNFYHKEFLEHYYKYLFVGGMPEAAKTYISLKKDNLFEAIKLCREIQNSILTSYESDFLTHNFKNNKYNKIASKVGKTFNVIAQELFRNYKLNEPVKKFRFKSLSNNTSYTRVSHIFDYLVSSGLVIKVPIVSNPTEPLLPKEHESSSFKCYYWDTGMLNAKLDVSYKSIIEDSQNSYKGYIAENFVAQHLHSAYLESVYAWSSKNYEVEFLLKLNSELSPLEVKSSKRDSKSPSLNNYIKKYNPKNSFKVAPQNFVSKDKKKSTNDGLLSLPIYFVEKLDNFEK